MKRLRLLRGVMVNGAGHAENAVVDVSDADARLLLGGSAARGTTADAVLVKDLGRDEPAPGTVAIEVRAPIVIGGAVRQIGERLLVNDADAKRLLGNPRVLFVPASEPPAAAPAREKAKR